MNHTLATAALAALSTVPLTAQLGIKIDNLTTTTAATYITVPYHKSLVPQTGLTIEAWITYDETTLATGWRWPTIARQNPNASKESFWLRIQAGQNQTRRLGFATTTSSGLRTVNYDFTAGEFQKWTHVAGTYDGSALRLYVNGVLKSTLNGVGANLIDSGGVLNIGNGDGNVIENWNGEIDEVRLWPYARTANEIMSTMNIALANVPGRVSTWNLDFSPNDSSNGNNGTNTGTVSYQANSLKLTSLPLGGKAYGKATPGCAGTPAAGVSGLAENGNQGFAITCLDASTGSGAVGFFFLGLKSVAAPVNVNGAGVWVDTSVGILLSLTGDANRLIKLPAPLPTGLSVGTKVYGQFLFAETGCNVPAFASEGLEIAIQR